jgi:hypothetical protein
MDFITGLPTTQKGNDLILVIIDRLTKSAHFLPVKTVFRPPQYAKRYIVEIIRLHGIPKTIVYDRETQFIAHFWEHLHKDLGTSLVRSTAHVGRINFVQKTQAQTLECEKYKSILIKFTCREEYSERYISTRQEFNFTY